MSAVVKDDEGAQEEAGGRDREHERKPNRDIGQRYIATISAR